MNDPNSSEITTKICMMALFALFTASNFMAITSEFRISALILTAFNALIVIIYLIRRPAITISSSKLDYIICTIAMIATFFYTTNKTPNEISALQVISVFGLLLSFCGVGFLGKSLGFLPANRGIVTSGIYKYIRHPIYAGYIISHTCFFIQNYNQWNIIIYLTFLGCETTRLFREEAFLKQNEAYLEYTKKTRWRLIPFIW